MHFRTSTRRLLKSSESERARGRWTLHRHVFSYFRPNLTFVESIDRPRLAPRKTDVRRCILHRCALMAWWRDCASVRASVGWRTERNETKRDETRSWREERDVACSMVACVANITRDPRTRRPAKCRRTNWFLSRFLSLALLIALCSMLNIASSSHSLRESPYNIKDNIDFLICTYIISKNYILMKQKIYCLFNAFLICMVTVAFIFIASFSSIWLAYWSFSYFQFYILLF